ncbi:hypothetical protein BH10PSE7_BH10PSE7_28230 [soil metagenome]
MTNGMRGMLGAFQPVGKRRPLLRFSLAVLIFAGSLGARALIDWLVPGRVPFITFFPALLLAAYYCGAWPSLMVLVLSALSGVYLTVVPEGGGVTYRLTIFVVFLLAGGANVAAVLYLVRSLSLLRARDERLALINSELKHRLKNVFAVTEAITRQTIRGGGEPDDMTRAISGRIRAIAAAQDVLTERRAQGSDLRSLIETVVAPLSPTPERLKTSGPPFDLPERVTTPFSLILHELATNAVKYGAWRPERGVVSVSWTVDGSALNFLWREHDGPPIAPPVREGLGSTLIKRGLPDATVEHRLHDDGAECRISLPL